MHQLPAPNRHLRLVLATLLLALVLSILFTWKSYPSLRADRECHGTAGSFPGGDLLKQFFDSLTIHGALKTALIAVEDTGNLELVDRILEQLRWEWVYVGSMLLGLLALQTSVFTLGSQSVFNVNALAQKAIAASGIATSFGLVSDGWFLLRFYRLPPDIFLTRARDIYGSYIFFSLSARLSLFGALIALGALVLFIGQIAFSVVPTFVVFLAVIFCVILGLQFLIRGADMVVRSVIWAGSYIRNRLMPPRISADGRVSGLIPSV
ncbi:hypothetical protein FB45DRAFT_834744 [Roridomyces roridus]|uniref:Uncharacterized protein n=1 Tax=Roridomyces roridus TaxID=1738132 RepID=A0AAD7BRY1_9AGAR|nr:hypothetical protein FB45DRAFT_834744 [Roridomyces roridus]